MAERLHIGALIPTWYTNDPPRGEQIAEYCRAAEELGFDSLWSLDRLFGVLPALEPCVTLSWAAAVTRRVRLGSAVILAALRQPAWLAKETATLDYLSGGRLTLGVSLGGSEDAYAAVGVPLRQRTKRLEETVAILRRLWTEDEVTWKSRYYDLRQVTIEPKPVQRPVPILIGARADDGLRRAGELADGWIANAFSTVEETAQGWRKVQQFARAAGRDPSQLEAAKLLYLWIDDNIDRARDRAVAYYQPHYPIARLDVASAAVYGPPEVCAQAIQAYVDAGIRTLILGPTGLDNHQLELLMQKVVPQLRLTVN